MADYVGLETSGHVLLEDGSSGLLLETSLIIVTGPTPLNVAFTDLSTNTPTSWAWDFGDGGTSTVRNPTHTYATPGTYTVTLVATNAGGSNTKIKVGYVVAVLGPVAVLPAGLQLGPSPVSLGVQFDYIAAPLQAGLRLGSALPTLAFSNVVTASGAALRLAATLPGFVGQAWLFEAPACVELTLAHYGNGGSSVPPVEETIEDAIRVPDLTLYYRMGNAFAFPPYTGAGWVASGGVLADTAGFAIASPGVPRPANLNYSEFQGAGWTVANRPTLAVSHDMSGDDGAVQFNYDQQDFFITRKAGCAFGGSVSSYEPGIGGIALANFGTTLDYAQAFSVFFKPQKTTGAPGTYLDYQSQILGTWAMDITGSYNEGWGLVFGHHSMTLSWNLRLADLGFAQLVAPAPLEDDRWYHAAGTWDGAVYRLYLDGAEVASLASTLSPGEPSGTPSALSIGYGDFDFGVTSTDGFFFGSIDEVAIYSRPLSALEIQHISDVGHAGSDVPPDPNEIACIELVLEPALCR